MRLALSLLFALMLFSAQGQLEKRYGDSADTSLPEWVQLMYADSPDAGQVIRAYNKYYSDRPFVKNKHTQYYKRWLRSISREIPKRPKTDQDYLSKSDNLKQKSSSNPWMPIGPIDWDHEASGLSYAPGSAHVYTVERAPSNTDIMYAGTATAGIWKSLDRGQNWFPLTDQLLYNGLTALEINPTNPDIVYVEMFGSIYKSLDGGSTWNPTGDASFQGISMDVKDIVAFPGDNNGLMAATSEGLYRSPNQGTNWVQVESGEFQEVEFHPSNNNIIYAVKLVGDATQFWRSTNAGITFTQQTNGWPVPNAGDEQKRTEIAVSPANESRVVALCTGAANGGSGLYGIYVSNDQGQSWTFSCCGPQPGGPPSTSNMNLMAWSDQGTDDGGQYYYDLALDLSPTNADSIFVAGVNLWISGDGGQTFNCPAQWSHSNKPNYVHADIHDIHYYDSNNLWVCGDGGIFFSSDGGDNFTRSNVGISGTDFWGFGMGHWFGDVMLGGAYHNGTLLKEEDVYNNGWLCTDGGDGTLGFVNYGLDRQVYSWFNIKNLQSDRSIAPVTRDFNFKPNNTYITGRSSDLIVHPNYYTTWFSGSGTSLMRTDDNGYSYTTVHDFGEDLAAMDISWSDPNVMYVTTFPDWWATKKIYRTLDGGQTWTDITPSSTMVNGNTWIPYDIAVSERDPMKLWIVRTSMYGSSNIDGFAVFESSDGGSSWHNISGSGLNGETPTCMMYQKGTDGGVYVGTRRAVYYKSDSEADWQLYNSGLPLSTASTRIEMYYRKKKVRNATNRSVWESSFFESSQPYANPSVNRESTACVGDTFYFVDHSIVEETGVTWQWSFPGGTPASSNLRTPEVVYQEPGSYDVTLTVTDQNGSDTKSIPQMAKVYRSCRVDRFAGNTVQCGNGEDHVFVENFDLDNVSEFTVTAWIKPSRIQDDYASIFMTDGDAAGLNFREGNNTLAYHWPGGQWWWDSNLEVPVGEWAHVALVADGSSISVYLNGYGATHNIGISAVDMGNIRIGSYKNWASRNFDGLIDEVAIYDRALTQEEIRLTRHLTKIPEDDTALIAYYQMNEEGSQVIDKVGNRNGTLTQNAAKVRSTAPTGGGLSERKTITNGGPISFETPGVTIGFANGSHPNGEVVVSHIEPAPDVYPTGFIPLDQGYWVINNYGQNQSFSTLDSMTFKNTGTVTNTMSPSNNAYGLFTRSSNADGDVWQGLRANELDLRQNIRGEIKFAQFTAFNNFSQFIIQKEDTPVGIPDISISGLDTPTLTPKAGSTMALHLDSDNQGLGLPAYTSLELASGLQPELGHIAFCSDEQTLVLFNGSTWEVLAAEAIYTEFETSLGSPTKFTYTHVDAADPSAVLALKNTGYLKLPNLSNEEITSLSHPIRGMLIYNTDDQQLQFYNDHHWQGINTIGQSLSSGNSTAHAGGISTYDNNKISSSVLEVDTPNKTLCIPSLERAKIKDPKLGLMIYDPTYESILVFDGNNWRVMR